MCWDHFLLIYYRITFLLLYSLPNEVLIIKLSANGRIEFGLLWCLLVLNMNPDHFVFASQIMLLILEEYLLENT